MDPCHAHQLEFDPDLIAIAVYMQQYLPASRLVPIAKGLAAIAPLLWGEYESEVIHPFRLVHRPISLDDPRTQSAAIE